MLSRADYVIMFSLKAAEELKLQSRDVSQRMIKMIYVMLHCIYTPLLR